MYLVHILIDFQIHVYKYEIKNKHIYIYKYILKTVTISYVKVILNNCAK